MRIPTISYLYERYIINQSLIKPIKKVQPISDALNSKGDIVEEPQTDKAIYCKYSYEDIMNAKTREERKAIFDFLA